MALNDAPYNCQPNAGAFKLLSAVQSLKYAKQFVRILHVETTSVIPHKHSHKFAVTGLTTNHNPRALATARVLHGIREEIDDHLMQQRLIPIDPGQFANLPSQRV